MTSRRRRRESCRSTSRATSRMTPRRGRACARRQVALNRNGERRAIATTSRIGSAARNGTAGRVRTRALCLRTPETTATRPVVFFRAGRAAARDADGADEGRASTRPRGARSTVAASARSSRCLPISVTTKGSRASRCAAARRSMGSGNSSASCTTSRSSPTPDSAVAGKRRPPTSTLPSPAKTRQQTHIIAACSNEPRRALVWHKTEFFYNLNERCN